MLHLFQKHYRAGHAFLLLKTQFAYLHEISLDINFVEHLTSTTQFNLPYLFLFFFYKRQIQYMLFLFVGPILSTCDAYFSFNIQIK